MALKAWAAAGAAIATIAILSLAPATSAQVQTVATATPLPDGAGLFDQHCKSCHAPPIPHAPSRETLAAYPKAGIVEALTSGAMAPMAKGLSGPEIDAIAGYLTSAPGGQTGSGPQRRLRQPLGPVGVDKMCGANPPIHSGASDWNRIGHDADTSRYQPNPDLRAVDTPRLKVKWAYTMTGGGQPTVVGDWLFVTNRSGKFYALDAKTGCVRWVDQDLSSRSAPMVFRSAVAPSGWVTIIGVGRTVHALDAQTGKALWKTDQLETHPASSVGGALAVSGDRVFVPFSSGEEVMAMQSIYACCTFRGSVVALDLKTGRRLWKTTVITEPSRPLPDNAAGARRQGPAGGAIWSAPTADARRGLVYVATGDSYTDAPTKGDDAIVAIEMKTGKIRWSAQVTQGDNYIMGCEPGRPRSANCNNPQGPDYDFGASPILMTLKGGKQVLLAGQKSGLTYGFNPDTGKRLWTTRVGAGSALGGVEWGMAVDRKLLFAPSSDLINLFNEVPGAPHDPAVPTARPGLTAIEPATGRIVWTTPAPDAICHYAGDRSSDYVPNVCMRAQSQAPAAMPGVVFDGTMDGWFRAYDARTGKILWAYSTTAQTYDTVNGVKGQPGGGIDGYGPVIAGGMVYTMSGFNGAANTGGNGNNVLLAFSVDGK
jgi:polyvinyl alcohol dehydrogenase (cytochrome)